jgi:hypothetical protein
VTSARAHRRNDSNLVALLDLLVQTRRTLLIHINILQIHRHGTARKHLRPDARVSLLESIKQLAGLDRRRQVFARRLCERGRGGKVEDREVAGGCFGWRHGDYCCCLTLHRVNDATRGERYGWNQVEIVPQPGTEARSRIIHANV